MIPQDMRRLANTI